ncbi:Trypsin-like peptidase domain-containing protein [Saccharicrinis carchari]|uniref:Trypsin-like peptidase domain-containing protein n=1 Tax=Saccharicrinis carchari TaxID=1168039 RepID=A0A521EIE3_SACCC|nr:trypsin-like peptidase domain-containing protein [Saccharicrinis carchari]SMO83622.1 Trypsin-like peptidase domain-containing protein [Saccharicrinis carchari]
MKAIPYQLTIFVLILLYGTTVEAQSVMEKIAKLEKAVFSISAYDAKENVTATRTGFFISGDGIAIAPASLFLDADSISLTLRNGRSYEVSHLISIHKMADLVLFKASGNRDRSLSYIIPSQETDKGNQEVLIFSHPQEAQGGLSLGTVSTVFQAPYLDRLVKVDSDFGPHSTGAPVMNSEGDLIGIASYLEKTNTCQFISTHVINDTLWEHSANNSLAKDTTLYRQKILPHPHMFRGISYLMNGDWVEAARNFTREISRDSTAVIPYIFRGEARRNYHNSIGMEADYAHAKKMDPKHFLIHYFEAMAFLRSRDDRAAFKHLITCLDQHPYFSPALIEFGLLAIKLHKDILTAKKSFEKAIKSSPIYANGYYELARLNMQYFREKASAMENLNKAISLNEKLPGVYSIRGTLRIQSENYLEAISDLDKAITIDTSDTHALFNRGLAFYNLGMKEKCCRDWDMAGQLGHYKSIKYLSRYCNKTPISPTRQR